MSGILITFIVLLMALFRPVILYKVRTDKSAFGFDKEDVDLDFELSTFTLILKYAVVVVSVVIAFACFSNLNAVQGAIFTSIAAAVYWDIKETRKLEEETPGYT